MGRTGPLGVGTGVGTGVGVSADAGADAGAGVDGIAVGGDVVGGVGDMKILYGGRRRRIWKR